MDASSIGEMVNTVGFPIAAFCLMFYLVNTTLKELQATLSENTKALTRLSERMEHVKGGGGK